MNSSVGGAAAGNPSRPQGISGHDAMSRDGEHEHALEHAASPVINAVENYSNTAIGLPRAYNNPEYTEPSPCQPQRSYVSSMERTDRVDPMKMMAAAAIEEDCSTPERSPVGRRQDTTLYGSQRIGSEGTHQHFPTSNDYFTTRVGMAPIEDTTYSSTFPSPPFDSLHENSIHSRNRIISEEEPYDNTSQQKQQQQFICQSIENIDQDCFRPVTHAILRTTTKRVRVYFVAFVASVLLFLPLFTGKNDPITAKKKISNSSFSSLASRSLLTNHTQSQGIRIFYNVFIQSQTDAPRVLHMLNEQVRSINPDIHDEHIYVTSIGHKLKDVPELHITNPTHYRVGGEDMTLHALWEYCRTNEDAKVVYLHSKGSYHQSEKNDRLRRFLTEGALSDECANLPDTCNVCSSRMSPLPHPHTSGNMWLARCSYIAKLMDPYALRENKMPKIFKKDDGCKGFGRYFFEHWVYSHPEVRACDVYPGKEYTWAYENIPDVNFTKDLREAPRFGFDTFAELLYRDYYYCQEDKSSQTAEGYLENRKWMYNALYNMGIDDSWYLWKFVNNSDDKGKKHNRPKWQRAFGVGRDAP